MNPRHRHPTLFVRLMATSLLATLVAGCTSPDMSEQSGSEQSGPEQSEPTATAPLAITAGLFDVNLPDTLGLTPAAGTETFRVFTATNNTHQYNHGAVTLAFNGRLYVQWQSSARDEDAPDTEVRYATSSDGKTWSAPITLAGPRQDAIVTNGGWWTDGNTLIAYLNIWPADAEPKSGYTEYVASTDGRHWSLPQRVTTAAGTPLAGIIEQDLRQLNNGRILTAVHRAPGLIATPYYTADPLGISGWTAGQMDNLPHKPGISRELEPSGYQRPDGSLVMTFRDQASSFRILASGSLDQGAHWSTPVATDFPDSRAKQSAGNLPDGSAFIVNNPSAKKDRFPLVISTSADGRVFDRAYLLRAGGADLPAQKFSGRYKRVGYSYPKSYVYNGYVYVSYATGKEDIDITRIPVSSIDYK